MVLLFEHNFFPASASSLLSTIIFRVSDFAEFEFIFNALAFYRMLCSILFVWKMVLDVKLNNVFKDTSKDDSIVRQVPVLYVKARV